MDNPNQVPGTKKQQTEHFESDTDRIIHRHLANENDVITEEDIRNIRIGVTPAEREKEDFEQQVNDAASAEDNLSQAPTENPTTPWDIVEP